MKPKRLIFSLGGLTVAFILLLSAAWIAFRLASLLVLPAPVSGELYPGITYVRTVRFSPRPMVVHIIKVDLREDGIELLVTPGDPDVELPLTARTTTEFVEDFGLQVAINGDGFSPWHSYGILDYYPHSGERVAPLGYATSRGDVYATDTDSGPTLYLAKNNRARFNLPEGRIYNAISGTIMLVEDGDKAVGLDSAPASARQAQPRTAVALDERRRTLYLIVIDGRQPFYSHGATLEELAEIILEAGGQNAMNLDGGGSSTLAWMEPSGAASTLNSPIHQHIPWRQRPVGNHLGVYALPVEE
jgi:hypothetical protein